MSQGNKWYNRENAYQFSSGLVLFSYGLALGVGISLLILFILRRLVNE